jgi:CheY-like chemotaxis protein
VHSSTPAAKAQRTVLLVDDDPDFLFQQKVQLEAAGFQVVTAPARQQAEEWLNGQKPDLAVVDLMMEQPDAGFTLCHHLRKKYPDTPVIVVSSINNETGLDFDVATEAERSWIKADAFLPKPIRFEQLMREIDRLLKD